MLGRKKQKDLLISGNHLPFDPVAEKFRFKMAKNDVLADYTVQVKYNAYYDQPNRQQVWEFYLDDEDLTATFAVPDKLIMEDEPSNKTLDDLMARTVQELEQKVVAASGSDSETYTEALFS